MASPPVFCDHCGAVFASPISLGGGTYVMAGNLVSCPNCGHMGRIPDGTYEVIGNTIRFLRGPNRSVEQLRRLAEILEHAVEARVGPEKVAGQLDEAGDKDSADFIRSIVPRNPQDWVAYLKILVALVAIILGARAVDQLEIKHTIHHSIIEQLKDALLGFEDDSSGDDPDDNTGDGPEDDSDDDPEGDSGDVPKWV